jgi:PAS domain S-box-containing protein
MDRTEHADSAAGSLDEFVSTVDAFQETVGRMNRRYEDLEQRYLEINQQLEATNRRLQAAADENRRFGEYLDCILQGIDVGVVAVDEQETIRFFNPAAERLLGRTAGWARGRSFSSCFPGLAVTADSFAAERAREIEYSPAVGRETRLLHIGTFAIAGDGAVPGGIYVLHDLTASRKMEKELGRLRTLAALGEMSATLAHEIRNPLTGIAGYSGLLIRELEDGPQRRWAERIEEGVHRLDRLIMHMLEFAREPQLDRRPVRWQSLGREIANAFEESIRHTTITLTREFPDRWPETVGDAPLLRQAVLNLLHNAEQAMAKSGGGEIRFAIGHISAGDVEIEVADNGPGMEQQVLEQIFRPFFTTREQGTGLGLAIVRKIVEAHGGSIAVESRPNDGSRFTIRLPAGG